MLNQPDDRRLSWDDIETLRKAGLNELAAIGERYLMRRTWRTLWRKPVSPAVIRPDGTVAG